ncbi:hypothetical protein VUR80DRAFT_3696 [Thermomyces stellatus]
MRMAGQGEVMRAVPERGRSTYPHPKPTPFPVGYRQQDKAFARLTTYKHSEVLFLSWIPRTSAANHLQTCAYRAR